MYIPNKFNGEDRNRITFRRRMDTWNMEEEANKEEIEVIVIVYYINVYLPIIIIVLPAYWYHLYYTLYSYCCPPSQSSCKDLTSPLLLEGYRGCGGVCCRLNGTHSVVTPTIS